MLGGGDAIVTHLTVAGADKAGGSIEHGVFRTGVGVHCSDSESIPQKMICDGINITVLTE
jgi:hypothetical protein